MLSAMPALQYFVADPLVRNIEEHLAARDRQRKLVLALQLLVGVPACFAVPWLLSELLGGVLRRSGSSLGQGWAFVWLSLVFVPLFIWRAAHRRSDCLLEAGREVGVSSGDAYRASSYGEWEMRHTVLSWALYADLFLWGPGVVVDAWRAWRAESTARTAGRLRAAAVLRELCGR
jgi:hypothetical protein